MAIGETAGSNQGPKGIGGWLLLLAVGVCLSPLLIFKGIVSNLGVISGEAWQAITTVGEPAYHPLFGPLVIGETLVQLSLLAVSVVNLVCFFTKNRRFPSLMASLLITTVAYLVVDTLLASMIVPPAYRGKMGEQVGDIVRVAIPAFIWLTYLRRSRRVQNTFVR
ncbi:MAG TPA: DUF2569 domain-containing protein [Candidatus Nitrosotalea sp.]|jgi:hypothetical protein|nr:DUF2569 domain-containing protein [Candidatus Nitrosotalea sp.]